MSTENNNWLNEKGQLVLLTAGVVILIFIMFLLKHLINPLGYGLVVGVVLYPIRKQPVARALLTATLMLVGLWFLYDSGHLLIPFIVTFIIAFLFNPWVQRLEKYIPRWVIAIFFTIVGLLAIGLFFFVASPAVTDQTIRFNKVLISASQNAEEWIDENGITSFIDRVGLDPQTVKPQLASQITHLAELVNENLTGFTAKAISRITNIVGILFFVILMPFLLFFMIRDYEEIESFLRSLIVPNQAPVDYTRELGNIIGGYLRGQFIVVIISMFNLSLGFTLFGVPYGLVLGVFAGITNFIPTFGLWVAVTVSTIVGASLGDPWWQYLPYIYLVFGVEQVLESGFLVPRIIGKHVGLHPITVMISLLVFGFMFGFLGLIIAIPTTALLSIFYKQYKETRKLVFLSGTELDTFLQQFEPNEKRSSK